MSSPTSAQLDGDRLVRRVFVAWVVIEVVLVVLDTVVNYNRGTDIRSLQRMTNIAREDGVATWFSSVQLLLVSVPLGLTAWRLSLEDAKWRSRGWALVALFFAYLAFDDGAKIHERVATSVTVAIGGADADPLEVWSFFPSYEWQVIFGPFFAAMGLFIAVFFWKEMRRNAHRFLVFAGLSCYALAVAIDFLEGIPGGYEDAAELLGTSRSFASHYGRVVEEFLEMFGTTCFLGAFLGHFTAMCGPLHLRWKGED